MLTKITMYSPETIEAAYQEVEELKHLFRMTVTGKVPFREMEPLLSSAFSLQSPDGLIRLVVGQETPPVDIRCDLWYEPTYLTAGMLMHFWLNEDISTNIDPSWKDSFFRLLKASTGRKFRGDEWDNIGDPSNTLQLFCAAGLPNFLESFPDFCPEFTTQVTSSKRELLSLLKEERRRALWHQYRKTIAMLNRKDIELFVYGTLMRDRSNHAFLSKADFAGKGLLSGYALYELGGFPGIRPSEGDFVRGELYFVDSTILQSLNQLEGEGRLFHLESVSVEQARCRIRDVLTYVYLGDVKPQKKIDLLHQPWRKQQDGYVWYACYGSNLLEERFLCYLNGGPCHQNGQTYRGCRDKTPPKASAPITIFHPVYYGNHSVSWNGGGVSFLDCSRCGRTLGKMYLITEEQFYDIHRQEGAGKGWYDQVIYLDDNMGFDIFTITSRTKLSETEPDVSYMKTVRQGLQEIYSGIKRKELEEALQINRAKGKNTFYQV